RSSTHLTRAFNALTSVRYVMMQRRSAGIGRRSERNFVIQLARSTTAAAAVSTASAVAFVRARLAEVRAATAAGVADLAALAALPTRVQHLQLAAEFLQHHLGRVAILTGLVLPFAGLQLTLDINLHALLQVLLGDLGEIVVENHDIMPLGFLLALAAVLVAPAFRRRDTDVDDRIARIQAANFGISPKVS